MRLPRMGYTTIRFVALYLLLSFASAIPIFIFIYQTTDRLVLKEIRDVVADETASLDAEAEAGGSGRVAQQIDQRIRSGAASHGALLLVSRSGARLAGNLKAWPPVLRPSTDWAEMRLYRNGHTRPELIGLSATLLSSGDRLLVGRVMDDRLRLREALVAALGVALLLAFPVGLAGSMVLLRFMNRRVRAIGTVAAAVASGDFSRRVHAAATHDPFDELGSALNAMLERTESLVEELRFVTDGLAHDLRSPLMRIRASVDRAAGAADPQSCQSALDAVSNQIESMLQMLNRTLEVSRAEAGIGRENFEPVDLVALARDLCEMYQPLAEDGGVSVRLEAREPAVIPANRELLGQALANLVDNALKYASAGGIVSIGVSRTPTTVRLGVADRGPGIAEAMRSEAVRKYRRLDPARTSDGSGLGLALAGAIARLHGGTLLLEDNQPGLRAVLELPAEKPSGPADEQRAG